MGNEPTRDPDEPYVIDDDEIEGLEELTLDEIMGDAIDFDIEDSDEVGDADAQDLQAGRRTVARTSFTEGEGGCVGRVPLFNGA